jgi:hypothetical protein
MKKVRLLLETKSQVFIAVLIAFTIILTLGAAILMHSRSTRTSAKLQTDAEKAYALAQSGIAIGEAYLKDNPTATDPYQTTYSKGGGVVVVNVNPGVKITSTSDYKGTTYTATKPLIIGTSATTWAYTYGGTATDQGYYISQTEDGGYIIGGTTTSFGANTDVMLIKTDADGNVGVAYPGTWSFAYGGGGVETINYESQIAKCPINKGYIFAAISTTKPVAGSGQDMLFVKIGFDGTLEWARYYRCKSSDKPRAVIETFDGGYLFAMDTLSTVDGTSNKPNSVLLIKTDSQGLKTWAKIYDSPNTDQPFGLAEDSTGYIVVGSRWNAADTDAMVFKVNKSDGTLLAQKEYGTAKPGHEILFSVTPVSGGGYVITGETDSNGPASSGYNCLFARLDSSLNEVGTSNVFSDPSLPDQRGLKVKATSEGYAIGAYSKNSNIDIDLFLIRTNPSGGLLGSKAYGQSGAVDYLWSLDTTSGTSGDGLVLGGYTQYYGPNPPEFLIIKTDSVGGLTCSSTIPKTNDLSETPCHIQETGFVSFTEMTPTPTAIGYEDVGPSGANIITRKDASPVRTNICN